MIDSITDWQHAENLKTLDGLKAQGYSFEIGSNGYFVRYQGKGLGGAGVMLPRQKNRGRRMCHKQADIRNFTRSAISTAQAHQGAAK